MILASLLLALLPQAPSVVVFVADDVAASDLAAVRAGPWGLPAIEALAAEGVTMTRAYTHTWCSPTRDSMLRGVTLGRTHGDWACAAPGPDSLHLADYSLAHMFQDAGYATAYFGKWHLGVDAGGSDWRATLPEAGFDTHWEVFPIPKGCAGPGVGFPTLTNGTVFKSARDMSARIRDAYLAWWDSTPGPKFAVVNFEAAHAPFRQPDADLLPPGWAPVTGSNRELYEAEILALDRAMGPMLARAGPTAIRIFTADNGTPGALLDGSLIADATRPDQDPFRVKLSPYEDGVHVPLIVAGPGIAPGTVDAALVHAADFLPTLREALGLTGPPLPGVSLLSAVRDHVFVWWGPGRPENAVIGHRYKLVTTSAGIEELYDLLMDPTESNPLPPIGPIADGLRARRVAALGS